MVLAYGTGSVHVLDTRRVQVTPRPQRFDDEAPRSDRVDHPGRNFSEDLPPDDAVLSEMLERQRP